MIVRILLYRMRQTSASEMVWELNYRHYSKQERTLPLILLGANIETPRVKSKTVALVVRVTISSFVYKKIDPRS